MHGAFQLLHRKRVAGGDVQERAQGRHETKPFPFFDVRGCKDRAAKDTFPWNGLSKTGRNDEVGPIGEHVAEVVESEGTVVRNHRLGDVLPIAAPKEQPDQIIVLGNGNRGEAVEPASHTFKIADFGVVV